MLIPIETVTQTVVILVLRLWIQIPHVFPSSLYLFMTSDCDNDENTRTEHWTLNTSVEKFLIRFSEHGQKLDNAWCNLALILVVLARIHIITLRQWCLLNHANSDWDSDADCCHPCTEALNSYSTRISVILVFVHDQWLWQWWKYKNRALDAEHQCWEVLD